jgi:hypothetical protein
MAEKLGAWHTPEDIASRDDRGGLTSIKMSTVREKTAGMAETDLADGWTLVEIFELQDGKPVVAELKIFPRPPKAKAGTTRKARNYGHRSPEGNGDSVPKGGVTASLLRQVKPGIRNTQELLNDYRDWLTNYARAGRFIVGSEWGKGMKPEDLDELQQRAERFDEQIGRPSRAKTGKGRRQTDRYYSQLAMDYERLCREGSRSPVKTMAEERDLDIGRMRSHVHRARRNGFLTATAIGTSGGFATDKAKRVFILDTAGKLIAHGKIYEDVKGDD